MSVITLRLDAWASLGKKSGGQRVYPIATVHVDQREIAHWLDEANEQRAPGAKRGFFQQARASLAEVQLADPSVTIVYDVDPAAARAQRPRAFADAAHAGHLVAPAHVAFPGVGRVRAEGRAYRWLPMPYVNDAPPLN